MTDCASAWLVLSWQHLAAAAAAAVALALASSRLQGRRVTAAAPSSASTELCAASNASAMQPKSVNYHFTRQCNYKCGFCFHTAKSPSHLPLERAKQGLRMLRQAGMEKINFSGGEPLLIDEGEYLGQLCRFCKELGLFVSIVTNGSLMTEQWIREHASFIDIVAVSCDSFDDGTNRKIGRWDTNNPQNVHKDKLREIAEWCHKLGVGLKVNTVVNSFNCDENMSREILTLKPIRWKCFQVLEVEGENKKTAGFKALRNASKFVVSTEQFNAFIRLHESAGCHPVAEPNAVMRASYFLLDEHMRFLDCSTGGKVPSVSILDDLPRALSESGFAAREFKMRDGDFYQHMQARPPAAALAVALEEENTGRKQSAEIDGRTDHVNRASVASACSEIPEW